MKSDSTPASTTSSKETPSKSLFSNPAALSTPAWPQIVAASKTFPFEINDVKEETAESSLKVPSSSASTANETSVKTPNSVETPPFFQIPANSGIPYFEDSNRHFSNASREVLQKQRPKQPSQIRSKTKPFLQKIVGNLSQIEDDHLNEITWIRKLSNQKWISFLDIFLGGLTLLFFTIAFYLIFHVNPTLETKLSPEFKAKIRTMLNEKNFQNCNHFSWIQTTKKETTVENSIASIIDDSRCFTKYQNGRSFFETYKSSTPNSTDGRCNIDRVEVRPCYNESNPMNIFWGVNDTVLRNTVANVYCNGTVLDGPLRNFYSFSPPVLKYPMIDTMISPDFFNRTISSAAFFFQCPKCVLAHRIHLEDSENEKPVLWYEIVNIENSIPSGAKKCETVWGISCKLDKNYMIQNSPKSFSQRVLPFVIAAENDEEFCG